MAIQNYSPKTVDNWRTYMRYFVQWAQERGLHYPTPNRLSQLVRDYIDAPELGKRGSCHLFRHTCATLMMEGGADIRFIQQLLGHAELSTTQIYTQVSIQQLKQVHSVTHPARLERGAPKLPGKESPRP